MTETKTESTETTTGSTEPPTASNEATTESTESKTTESTESKATESTESKATESTESKATETTESTTPLSRDQLLDRMDHGWTMFEALTERVHPDRFGAPTSSGWALGSMLAHVAAWHDETTHRLYRYMATGRQQPPPNEGDANDDAYNARVVEESRDRSPEQLRHSLRRSYARLRGAVAELDATLDDDGWVAAIVGGNTHEHYEEHQPEVEAALA
jgi:hypothetical protein